MKSGTIFLLLGLLALWAELPPAAGRRPGVCPSVKGVVGICVELCNGDESCPPGQKCCSNGCGHVCRGVITRGRPGTCPTPTGQGACVERCRGDDSCPPWQKCCSNGCGHECKQPVPRVKPGLCPIHIGPGTCEMGCDGDESCPAREKCCSKGCGQVCKRPITRGKTPQQPNTGV
nr:WAP four-disulfide core domain protein 3 [Pelodiscus sinensis]|eukprot:XP_025044607.1 WAP four-disulfide core domain protein 3 [Pelodiscus sinensis]